MTRAETDYQALLDAVAADIAPLRDQGRVADYIPALAAIPPEKFGMALVTTTGQVYRTGDAGERFSIQSISKLFTLLMAFRLRGDALWQRVGREPSGEPFNSLIQLELERGIPRNPFINAGALVVTDILCSHYAHTERAILDFLRQLSGSATINTNDRIARSEAQHGFRNAAAANLIKSFNNLQSPVDTVLRTYFAQCAVEMCCVEVAEATLALARGGVGLGTETPLLTASEAKRINAILLTCGTYDAAGDVAYRVGLPAKSGVGGGIVAVMPGEFTVCVWSPGLDANGNSLAGVAALESLTTRLGRSIF
ncbi:MAG: glutaminase [Burkholderiales bacterium]|nr:glutaminase [Burkholderiales bacterium]